MVFADLFRQRADYSQGLFYSGRNGIFSQNNSVKVHPEGPKIIRKSMIISSTKDRSTTEPTVTTTNSAADLKALIIQNQESEKENENLINIDVKTKPKETKAFANVLSFTFAKDLTLPQRNLKKRSNTIIIENHWKQELFGGIKTWVNQLTGEVSLEDPQQHYQVTPKHVMKATRGRSKTVDSSIRQYFPWRNSGKHENTSQRFGINFSGKFQESIESSKISCRNPDMKELFALLDGKKDESEKIITKPLQA